jgi:hypothetical protein
VVSPFHSTRATADVFIAAAQQAGGALAQALPFNDEVAYIQSKLTNLIGQPDGSFTAPEINSFGAYFQQHGGWWRKNAELTAPAADNALGRGVQADAAQFAGEGEFFFIPFVSPTLGEAGANKPWLQELQILQPPLCGTRVEMNPETGYELGIENDDGEGQQ